MILDDRNEPQPGDPEDLAPKPQSPPYGTLREAVARALVAEQLAEAATGELARVADVTAEQAYTALLALSEWTPGEPLTDEQCEAFLHAAAQQEPNQ